MSERFRPSSEEAFRRANELIKSFENKASFMGPNQELWNENLGRLREKMEFYIYKGNIFNDYLFAPVLKVPDEDEEAIFSPIKHKRNSPRIESITLKPKNPEVMLYTSIIFDASQSNPALILTQDSYSIFRTKGKDIHSLLIHYTPKIEWQAITITNSNEVRFYRMDDRNRPVENVDLPVKEALKRFSIPD